MLFCSVIYTGHVNAGKRYAPSTLSLTGNGTFCQTVSGTTVLGSTVTYFTGSDNCGSTGGGNPDANIPVTYQWYTDTDATLGSGTAIPGATSATYNASTTTVGTFYYYCIISWTDPDGAGGCSAGSISTGNVQIVVVAPPTTANAGSDFTTGSCVTTATLAGNTPTSGTGTWTIVSGPGAVTTSGSPTSGVTGLQAGVATTFRWTISNSPCTPSFDDVVITGGACANNDLCSGAISVACGGNYAGTTVGMTTESGLPNCGDNPSAAGVWYVYTGNGSTVTASLCNVSTSYDSEIAVYTGTSCGTLNSCIASNDQFCGNQSSVTFGTTVGTNYYILVNGWSGLTGSFELNITCCVPAVPGCSSAPSPANSAVNVSTCNTLTWTAPAAGACSPATGYNVYFGTTNPPPFVTSVATTSYTPSLAGNTTYYWQIRPTNASGTASGCSIWSFTTNANNQYNLVDDAISPSPYTCVTLTSAVNDQRGCAWDQNSTLGFASNFTYDWTINLGSNDGGADGMTFVIQNDPLGRCKCGTTGEFLGAGGITNSLIVEIDTYLNSRDRDDGMAGVLCAGGPDPDHMDIWLGGNINPSSDGNDCTLSAAERVIPSAIPLLDGGLNYNIENGLDHKLRVSWNAATSTITVSIMNNATTITYGTVSYSFNPLTVFGTNSPYFGFTGSTGGLSNNQTFCNPPVLLPVEMSDFNMNCDEGYVTLNWSTNSEHNNDYFKVERSRDGQVFEMMAIIDGAGNATGSNEYSWSDNDPATGLVYYKLSQVDFDGTEKVLNEISTNCSELSGIQINSLTQSDGQMKLNLTNEVKGNYTIELMECSGKVIANTTRMLESGTNELFFTDVQVSKGIYFVRVGNSGASAVRKVGIF